MYIRNLGTYIFYRKLTSVSVSFEHQVLITGIKNCSQKCKSQL